ncbi:tripartite motif-containing protein 2-like [Pecten maximus]|uniref:tripartite motif-containing protein 2-like n=1 Tax=Pecten maximus TaxID=6579 RepID=UPI0014587A2D|nr:tripartite motif-containing protein 2-like [Pecten maximus]
MAEGGEINEQSSVDGDRSCSLDSLVLECPICLEQLRHPKSLPCLHSFCEECLGRYIAKELSGKMASASSFCCPVCRRVTEPVNKSEGKESWAEQFPTNNLAVEMIKHLQNIEKSITCKPCEKKGNANVPAKFWCKLANTYFCAACKNSVHDLFHEECEPENVTELKKSVIIQREMSITGCGKHNEKLEYYCEDHQLLGCSKCIIVDHRKCEVVTSADDFREKLRNSSEFGNLLEELLKFKDSMETFIKDVDEQLLSITQYHDSGLKSLSDLRKKVNERLDTLQEELTVKLITYFKEEKENLDISRKKCERLMFAMQNTLTSSKAVDLMDDTVGTICLFQRGQAEVESCKVLIQEFRKSSRSTSLLHEYDPDILAVDTKTSLSMGKIVVHQQERKLPSTACGTPLSERQLKRTGKFNIKLPSDKNDCSLLSIVFMSGGRIVVGDNGNRKMKLFTETGDFRCDMKLKGETRDLCQIDDNSVAVILKTVKTILVVNVADSTLTVKTNIKIPNLDEDELCYGITYNNKNNSFVVGTKKSLISVPRFGGEPTKLHTIESKCFHIASDKQNGHVFASIDVFTPGKVAVIRLCDGTPTDTLKVGILKDPAGIDVDREGNVYVCDWASGNIIQMSGEGTNVRELLTSSDQIVRPRAISIWDDTIVITSGSSSQRNVIHVFQLIEQDRNI